MQLNDGDVSALIRLLEDPDQKIYNAIKPQILEYGQQIIPFLESAWEDLSLGPLFQERIEEIIEEIQFSNVQSRLIHWFTQKEAKLLEGLFIVSAYQYPDLDQNKYLFLIEKLAKEVWLELSEDLTIFEKIQVLNQIVFEFNNFRGNTTNFHSPQNSFINDVLDTKKGNPVLLSCLYMIIGKRLGITFSGVNLPKHFILKYSHQALEEDIYINVFNKGALISKRDVLYFLKQLKIDNNHQYFSACSNKDIVLRILNNLTYSYTKLGHTNKVNQLESIIKQVSEFI